MSTHATLARRILFCALLPIVTGYATIVSGGPFTTEMLKTETNLMLQSVIVDSDVFMLGLALPASPQDVLVYTSSTNDKGWTGLLVGSFGGHLVNIAYTGVVTGDPDWSVDSQGTIDTNLWKGKANAHGEAKELGFLFNPLDDEIGIGFTVPLGGAITWSIEAKKDLAQEKYKLETGVGVGEVKIGDHIKFSVVKGALEFELSQVTLDYESALQGSVFGIDFESLRKEIDHGSFSDPASGLPITNQMTVQSAIVPEASSLLLLSIGLVGGVLPILLLRWGA